MGGRVWWVAGLSLLLAGCGAEVLPEGGADYQLGGAYPPPDGVTTVVRDSTAEPEPGIYSVCYVNGFQTQPGELDFWLGTDLLLLDEGGEPVADPGWPDEMLLDTSTEEKRGRIAEILGETIDRCSEAGFDAVEFDNLDSYLRSNGALTVDDNLALAEEIVGLAHEGGLDAGQKNAAEVAQRGRDEAGFDFAVAESCAAWAECPAYTDVYGSDVIAVEYPGDLDDAGTNFDVECENPDVPSRFVLRDLDLVEPGDPEYVYAEC